MLPCVSEASATKHTTFFMNNYIEKLKNKTQVELSALVPLFYTKKNMVYKLTSYTFMS